MPFVCKQTLKPRDYRKIPHHHGWGFHLPTLCLAAIIATLISGCFASGTLIRFCKLIAIQYAIIWTCMYFLYFQPQWTDDLLGLVCGAWQHITGRKQVPYII